jgi:hypothetical protein
VRENGWKSGNTNLRKGNGNRETEIERIKGSPQGGPFSLWKPDIIPILFVRDKMPSEMSKLWLCNIAETAKKWYYFI